MNYLTLKEMLIYSDDINIIKNCCSPPAFFLALIDDDTLMKFHLDKISVAPSLSVLFGTRLLKIIFSHLFCLPEEFSFPRCRKYWILCWDQAVGGGFQQFPCLR